MKLILIVAALSMNFNLFADEEVTIKFQDSFRCENKDYILVVSRSDEALAMAKISPKDIQRPISRRIGFFQAQDPLTEIFISGDIFPGQTDIVTIHYKSVSDQSINNMIVDLIFKRVATATFESCKNL